MKYVQIIDFESQRFGEMQELLDAFEQRMKGTQGGPTHRILLKDRDTTGRYLAIVEFDTYEDAMRSNERPEVTELNQRLTALCTRPPAFTNCDLKDMRELK